MVNAYNAVRMAEARSLFGSAQDFTFGAGTTGVSAGDKLDLNTIDADTGLVGSQDFSNVVLNKTSFSTAVGAKNFTKAGEILAFTSFSGAPAGTDVIVALNTDSDLRDAEMMIALNLANNASKIMTDAHFIL
jgi:hypothetical protein